MLKDFFIIWITVQLMLIGMVEVAIENSVTRGTYKCEPSKETLSPLYGAVIPILAFVPESPTVKKYCNK